MRTIVGIMSWWAMITTYGRLLQNAIVTFSDGEIRVSGIQLEAGEEIAILIDQMKNNARLCAPFEECQVLASRHAYQLVTPPQTSEPLTDWTERPLAIKSH